MKTLHDKRTVKISKKELLKAAKESETAGDWKEAEATYREIIRTDPHNEVAYDRLMIIYRKQKEWDKERQVLKKAISVFEDRYASSTKPAGNSKVSRLSRSLLKITGLIDRKGKPVYLPGPLAKWKRRKMILEKKSGKA